MGTIRKIVVRGFLLLGVLALVGCAAPLTRTQMIAKNQGFVLPQPTKEAAGLVYVVRPTGVGQAVRFNIFIDNPDKDEMEAGYTRGNQYLYFYLSPGKHVLYSKAENTATGTITVESGKTYFIQQVPSMGFLFARNQLKQLDDEEEGKYYLSQCKPGTVKRTSFE